MLPYNSNYLSDNGKRKFSDENPQSEVYGSSQTGLPSSYGNPQSYGTPPVQQSSAMYGVNNSMGGGMYNTSENTQFMNTDYSQTSSYASTPMSNAYSRDAPAAINNNFGYSYVGQSSQPVPSYNPLPSYNTASLPNAGIPAAMPGMPSGYPGTVPIPQGGYNAHYSSPYNNGYPIGAVNPTSAIPAQPPAQPVNNVLPSYVRSNSRSSARSTARSAPRSTQRSRSSSANPVTTPPVNNTLLTPPAPPVELPPVTTTSPNAIIRSVQWIRSFVPQAPIHQVINTLAQTKWDETAALSILSQKYLSCDLGIPIQEHKRFKQSPVASNMPTYGSSNRTVQSQKRSIRDKYIQMPNDSTQASLMPSYTRKTSNASKKLTTEEDEFYDSEEEPEAIVHRDTSALERTVLNFINSSTAKELSDTASCPLSHSKLLLEHRPFQTLAEACIIKHPDDVPSKPGRRGRRREKNPMGQKIVNACMETMEGYYAIDNLIAKCEFLGNRISKGMASWGIKLEMSNGELNIVDMESVPTEAADNSDFPKFVTEQPKTLASDVQLKSYQLVGVNWLHLLYQQKLSGILADEMGLGKTCQVVAFFALLLEQGHHGPHLVVVPSSTLENWLRELARFCPSLRVEPYYGSQQERANIREAIEENEIKYDILVTTYQLATNNKEDRSFLKHQNFDVCVYDEGHYLKNRMSERYKHLMNLNANFRLLLTGTPLQNNLKELVSLLAFILPNMFDSDMDDLDVIFKAKPTADADIEQALLSKQRISRAKTMMTPFVLRRRKNQVLNDLPKKTQIIEHCKLSENQLEIYNRYAALQKNQQLRRDDKRNKRSKNDEESDGKSLSAGHVLMQLRKAANHALLFRKFYDDEKLKQMAKDIMQEEQYKNANEQYIYEDMEVMSDFELHRLCRSFPTLQSYTLKDDPWMDSGKIRVLKELLPKMKEEGSRILLFSQFTQMLDILEQVLDTLKISYVRLDGSTQVEVRQDIIDQFHKEEDVTVFLLSTKAGGFGINLACANVVILYDCSYNPFDDLQAEDRAHRVGQVREVTVIRLITDNTIEEYIQKLANTKLALDMSLSSDGKDREEIGERLVQDMLDEENNGNNTKPEITGNESDGEFKVSSSNNSKQTDAEETNTGVPLEGSQPNSVEKTDLADGDEKANIKTEMKSETVEGDNKELRETMKGENVQTDSNAAVPSSKSSTEEPNESVLSGHLDLDTEASPVVSTIEKTTKGDVSVTEEQQSANIDGQLEKPEIEESKKPDVLNQVSLSIEEEKPKNKESEVDNNAAKD
ncbi:histone chaperone/ATP-dependent chromatin remodeller SMARCAD1 family Fft2 [Schizosaccharomyces pombe]|uniref:Chromatin remodeling protein fft2 n=1 Tax=Schizosaccharomyces pombe (strain 972 / ATCC 24843) TaxID=284812 RepID=FFT2_SCHPO|nr:putative protein Fft2 [Schizosaccharomyces pombe]O74842.1 RecName: Full=ATP-dependent helicase fft2; AltName: Full=Fun thirty-related protein 2 [Schizosaccharomyces pombe 972h-]CAA21109.1 fun thirty related protein Fft2 (predicted) [Schizosaccharomyces pombe]|eukprot:NP_587731.1 putative protein Fft2 [Schizosaccharomyces pombe]